MRPERIEFQAFGPYPGYECVDFNELASKGLFLICGNTGVGKTMILDAMTFALFGKSSGHARDDFQAMRCTNAGNETPTMVKFEFSDNGSSYIFERRLEMKRKNLSASYNLLRRSGDNEWEAVFDNPKEKALNEKAEEILGLDYEQFRQVIILPQGQFERLLTAPSDKKEQILSNIFGEARWQGIADSFYAAAENKRNELRYRKERIEASLLEEGCESTEELERLKDKVLHEIEELNNTFLKEDPDKEIGSLQEKLAFAKRFSGLKEEREKRTEAEKDASDAESLALKAMERAAEELKLHIGTAEKNEGLKRERIRLEEKREAYLAADSIEAELRKKTGELRDAERELKRAEEGFESLNLSLLERQKEYRELDKEYTGLFNNYIAGITGELAKELKDGEPCPVCGSREHPKKAAVHADNVSKELLDRKKRDREEKDKELNGLIEKREQEISALEERKNVFQTLSSEKKVIEARLTDTKKNLAKGIDGLRSLENAINDISGKISTYEKETDRLKAKEKEAQEKYTEKRTGHIEAEKELRKAEREFELIKRECGGAEPDESALNERLRELLQKKQGYAEIRGGKVKEAERLEKKLSALRQAEDGLDSALKEAAEDLAFAKKLRGDTGTGLQRYVLGIMFSSVISAANKMLELVHDGRYRLFRSDDKAQGTNKKGLELKVYDSFSGDSRGRFVNTLSGGEKFLVSLALSIGVSTVAQRGGIKIEALFIDEGFGSLDDDSIEDAMDILNSIGRTNGIVGIISHIRLLRDRIPVKLMVGSESSGSHIIESIG